jgi:threonine dehydrogenase-like Zn-dependent dehydrogenase
MLNQIARLFGLRTISVVDSRKHALKLSSSLAARPDIVVDNYDHARAIEIVRAATGKKLRFAVDTVGRETAGHLLDCLEQHTVLESGPDPSIHSQPAHLIGLSGMPKSSPPANITFHNVPIKVFHEIPELGEALMLWLERLLQQELLVPPTVLGVEEGFGSVNLALDSMRRGEISGGRLVVRVS